jgi:hypothetical protein
LSSCKRNSAIFRSAIPQYTELGKYKSPVWKSYLLFIQKSSCTMRTSNAYKLSPPE